MRFADGAWRFTHPTATTAADPIAFIALAAPQSATVTRSAAVTLIATASHEATCSQPQIT